MFGLLLVILVGIVGGSFITNYFNPPEFPEFPEQEEADFSAQRSAETERLLRATYPYKDNFNIALAAGDSISYVPYDIRKATVFRATELTFVTDYGFNLCKLTRTQDLGEADTLWVPAGASYDIDRDVYDWIWMEAGADSDSVRVDGLMQGWGVR